MALDLAAHLKELCALPGLSGHEAPVRDRLRAAWAPLADEITQDALGSLIATRRGVYWIHGGAAGGTGPVAVETLRELLGHLTTFELRPLREPAPPG